MAATVAALNALSFIASKFPNLNPARPIYAILAGFIPLTLPTSWGEFSLRYETQLSDYPIETGALAVYNKVKRPIGISVTLIKTGSDITRFLWLAAIQQAEKVSPTQLYTLISPQGIFFDYALTSYSYETRPDRGSNMLYLTLNFTQVIQIPSSANAQTNTVAAKSSPVAQIGQVYTNPASAAQTAATNAKGFVTK